MRLATLSNFFGPDTLIIFLVVLLLFAAKRLPEVSRNSTDGSPPVRPRVPGAWLDGAALILLVIGALLWIQRLFP